MKKRTCRRYTAKQRAEVIELCRELGPSATAKRLGMPRGTVSVWWWDFCQTKKKAGEAEQAAEHTQGGSGSSRGSSVQAPRIVGTSGFHSETEKTPEPEQGGRRRKVARKYTPSQKAEALEYAAKHGMAQASRKFGMSRFSLHDWKRRVEAAARGEGPSPTTGPTPAELEEQRDLEILTMWKRHPGLGPSQVRNQLRRQGIKVSVNTVRNVMVGEGYRPPRTRRVAHDKRFEAVRPNHLWHLDFVQKFINRASTFTLILLDDQSRFVVGHGVADAERADLVIDTFEEAVMRHGKPEMVIHDKGSAFWSWRGISRFTGLLTELGVDQVVAEHKEWNGKLEVFNANLQKELLNAHRFYDLAEMRRRLAAHLHWYNHQRTSHALGGLLVPADRYYGREDEARARVAAGASNQPDIHALDLRDRVVDLFKIVQRGRETELWLMGQRLLMPSG